MGRLENLPYIFRGVVHVALQRPETMKIPGSAGGSPAHFPQTIFAEDWRAGRPRSQGFSKENIYYDASGSISW